jgi:hypothetical protein
MPTVFRTKVTAASLSFIEANGFVGKQNIEFRIING